MSEMQKDVTSVVLKLVMLRRTVQKDGVGYKYITDAIQLIERMESTLLHLRDTFVVQPEPEDHQQQ